ncbi:MAG: helix-turn-helix domain-containing protein [Pseudomonadota bacterium]
MRPAPALLQRLEAAFLSHGYSALSMLGLAEACDVTARTLYNYFSNKEEAFRAAVLYRNEMALSRGFAAGREQWSKGGSALDILAAILDVRYGDTRRLANVSPHLVELNATVFQRCNDIVTTVAVSFEADLAQLIIELQEANLLRLRAGVTPDDAAQALANGARGVNQRLPPVPAASLSARYREMCQFILYGSAEPPPGR